MKKYVPSFSTGYSRQGEFNDCVIRAIANSGVVTYDVAHAELKKLGRIDQKATYLHMWLPFMLMFTYTLRVHGRTRVAKWVSSNYEELQNSNAPKVPLVSEAGITLENALKLYSKGNYVFCTKNHAFNVQDGKILDLFPNPANSYIALVFEVKMIE